MPDRKSSMDQAPRATPGSGDYCPGCGELSMWAPDLCPECLVRKWRGISLPRNRVEGSKKWT